MLKLPMLFDISTLVLLVGGCLLISRNLWGRREDILPSISGPEPDDSVEARAAPFETKELSELGADHRAGLLNAAPLQEPDAHAGAVSADQNHYATSVSAALAKSRRAATIVEV